jgi:hypothetical protein
VCYRPGADGPLGRRSGCWYVRCLTSLGLSAVRPACGLSALASAGGLVARAIFRSRRCFHRAGSIPSWVPPVGRGSWGLMPLAAAILQCRRRGRCSGGFPKVSRLARFHLGRRDLGSGRRGRRPAGIALSGRAPARMATEGFWNAREPRQWTWVDRRQLWQAPVEDAAMSPAV